MRGYSLNETIKNLFNVVYTKIFWKNARLVRKPLYIRNKKNMHFGKGFTCGRYCRLNIGNSGHLSIGDYFVMGDHCQIEAMNEVVIGDNVLLASKIYIGDASHGVYKGPDQSRPDIPPNTRPISAKPISIGSNVWIGNSVSILGGISIGDGVIIGANAVVTSNIPKECIAVGCPAKVIKRFDHISQQWIKNDCVDVQHSV